LLQTLLLLLLGDLLSALVDLDLAEVKVALLLRVAHNVRVEGLSDGSDLLLTALVELTSLRDVNQFDNLALLVLAFLALRSFFREFTLAQSSKRSLLLELLGLVDHRGELGTYDAIVK